MVEVGGQRFVRLADGTMVNLVIPSPSRERDFFIDNLLVRIHLIIEMILVDRLAPWEFEFP